MFCETTTEELKRVSIGKEAFEKLSPREIKEHNAKLNEVIKRATLREPEKFKKNAFLWQFK